MLLLILLQVIFLFLLFLGMVMYASEVETINSKKKKTTKLPEIKKLTTAYTLIVFYLVLIFLIHFLPDP